MADAMAKVDQIPQSRFFLVNVDNVCFDTDRASNDVQQQRLRFCASVERLALVGRPILGKRPEDGGSNGRCLRLQLGKVGGVPDCGRLCSREQGALSG